jgi:hypothetical protein
VTLANLAEDMPTVSGLAAGSEIWAVTGADTAMLNATTAGTSARRRNGIASPEKLADEKENQNLILARESTASDVAPVWP